MSDTRVMNQQNFPLIKWLDSSPSILVETQRMFEGEHRDEIRISSCVLFCGSIRWQDAVYLPLDSTMTDVRVVLDEMMIRTRMYMETLIHEV